MLCESSIAAWEVRGGLVGEIDHCKDKDIGGWLRLLSRDGRVEWVVDLGLPSSKKWRHALGPL